MTHKSLVLRIVVIALVFASAGAGAYTYLKQDAAAPSVTTGEVTRGDVVDAIAATGSLEAVTTVQVGTQVSGTVMQLLADFNDLVRTGQVLARLDPALFQSQLEQARANLVRAEADAERLVVGLDDARAKRVRSDALAVRQLIARSDQEAAEVAVRSAEAQLRSAQAQIVQARASLNQAQVNLDHTVIASPIDGIVVSRNVDVGQTVAASMQAPTLYVLAADLTRMRVNAKLDESDIGRVRPGQTVTFRVDAYPDQTFTGRVAQVRLLAEVSQNVVTYGTVIDVPNPQLRLKPGMTANVSVEVARRTDVLRVPGAALRFRMPGASGSAATGQSTRAVSSPPTADSSAGSRTASSSGTAGAAVKTVWRSTAAGLEPVSVQAGITDGSVVEIVSGALAVGDRLVTAMASGTTQVKTVTSSSVSNPLMGPQRPSGPPPGPPPGGGGD